MNLFSIPITQDTYVSSKEQFSNYSDSEELILSRSKQVYPQIYRENILLKVDLSQYSIRSDYIDKAYLCFSISKTTPCLKNALRKIIAFQNNDDFNYNTVNYSNSPQISDPCNFVHIPPIGLCNVCDRSKIIWENRCKDKIYICFDITTLVCYWLKNPEKNYGLSLLLECMNSTISFNSSRSNCGPSLIIKYKNYIGRFLMEGLQLQILNQPEYAIKSNETVIFDSVISNDSKDIIYNMTTGDFIFISNGKYYLSWWIGIGGSSDIKSIAFSFEDIDRSQVFIGASEIIISGQVCGNAYILIDDAPKKFRLLNISDGLVQYSINPPIQGNLTIISTTKC